MIIHSQNIGELLNQNTADLQQKLCQIGDSIVYKLVQWTRRLPFYDDLPVDIHTKLLTHKWHELLVLTTSAYQAIHGSKRMGTTRTDGEKVELHQEVHMRGCVKTAVNYSEPLYYVGGHQSCDLTNLLDLYDGQAHNNGPAAAGRGQHGREDHQSHSNLQTVPPQNGGVRLPQSDCHGLSRR